MAASDVQERAAAACRYADPELFFPIGTTGPARPPRTPRPRAQQARLPAARRRRDNRHPPRRRAIQHSDKITPADQPGSR